MINKIYIQQNKRQYLASKIAASSFVKNGFKKDNIFFIEFEKNEFLKAKIGRQYLRNGKIQIFRDDLQSFTLLRFLAPELNNFEDKILVIDPDVFAVSNPSIIFNEIDDNYDIGCTSYNGLLRSEVMIINAKKIRWNFNQIIEDLFNLKLDYSDLINLKFLKNIRVKEISKNYNSHDKIFPDTILLHTTNRITQPWKEGLSIDFQIYKSKFYILKQYIKKFLGKKFDNSVTQKKYLKHPDAEVVKLLKELFFYAKINGLISESEINLAIKNSYFSKVFLNSPA
jgi:hypothetical protein